MTLRGTTGAVGERLSASAARHRGPRLASLFDDALLVATVVVALGNRRLTEHGERVLKLVCGVELLALAAALRFRPDGSGLSKS